MLNPDDPESAQRIVAEYAALVERDLEQARHPASAASLPYPKQTIKAAIRTCVLALGRSGQMTPELREYLETAYVSLADYVADDLQTLMSGYRDAARALERQPRGAIVKTSSDEWRKVADTGALAGSIAHAIARETDELRVEFRSFAGRSLGTTEPM